MSTFKLRVENQVIDIKTLTFEKAQGKNVPMSVVILFFIPPLYDIFTVGRGKGELSSIGNFEETVLEKAKH